MQTLIADVSALLAAGVVSQGQAEGPIRKLRNATASLDRGNSIAAMNQIEAFQHEVEAFANTGILAGLQSQLLLNA